MAENYSDDMYSDAEAAPAPAEETKPEESKAEPANEQTALLPKAIFMGKDLKPGSRCEIEIVEGFDSEVSIRYVGHGEKKDEPDKASDSDPEMEEALS